MITAPGIGSGLDINSLVSQLVAAEGQPKALRFDQQEAGFQAKISALGQLKSALSEFAESLTKLSELSTFEQRTAESGDEELFTVSASEAAVPGRFGIEVVRLAESHKLASSGFASADTVVGTGTLSISTGSNSFSIDIDPSNNTVSGIRDAINDAQDNSSVFATLVTVDDGVGGSETRLLLTSDKTGTDNAITVTVSDADGNDVDAAGLSQLAYDPLGSGAANLKELAPAQDAQILVDTLSVTRSSNTISDAIEGVTIDLLASSEPGVTTELTVSLNETTITSAVEEFVSGYNALRKTINELTKFDAATGSAGLLIGDAGLFSMSSQVQRNLSDVVPGINAPFSTLSEIGITTQADGTLSIDSSALNDALDLDREGIAQLFASKNGVATRLDIIVDGFVGAGSALDARTEGLNNRIEDINDQRDALERRLVTLEARLLGQFTAMDALVGQLQSASNFITQQLAAFQAQNNRSRS